MDEVRMVALAQRLGCANPLRDDADTLAEEITDSCMATILFAYKMQPSLDELAAGVDDPMAIVIALGGEWITITDNDVVMATNLGLEFLREYGIEPALVDLDEDEEEWDEHAN